MRGIFGKQIKDLTPPQKHFLNVIQQYCSKAVKRKKLTATDITFYEKDIRAYSNISVWQVNHYLNDLVKLEYVVIQIFCGIAVKWNVEVL